MISDRVESESFLITHDFLGQMLGTHRPTVSVAAGGLEMAGAIAHERGQIHILDRAKLEETACECYQIMRALYEETFNRLKSVASSKLESKG
jgi:hypothetical protein